MGRGAAIAAIALVIIGGAFAIGWVTASDSEAPVAPAAEGARALEVRMLRRAAPLPTAKAESLPAEGAAATGDTASTSTGSSTVSPPADTGTVTPPSQDPPSDDAGGRGGGGDENDDLVGVGR